MQTFTENLSFWEQEKHKLSNQIYLKFNLAHFGEMSAWGNVIRGTVCRGNVRSGELSVWEIVLRGTVRRRKVRWGIVGRGNVCRELSGYL